MKEIKRMFTKGLMAGYAGETKREKVDRGGFQVKVSHFEEGGEAYHDEWAARRTGGGQELVRVGDQAYTRVYAGGTVKKDTLVKLGITVEEVNSYLRERLRELSDETRLFESVMPESDGLWQYHYQVEKDFDDIPFTQGMESITYKGVLVFVHVHLITPVE